MAARPRNSATGLHRAAPDEESRAADRGDGRDARERA
jgi:hypothetical protein